MGQRAKEFDAGASEDGKLVFSRISKMMVTRPETMARESMWQRADSHEEPDGR